MSDTPETDKIITDWMQGITTELPNFVDISRKLEREREEAMAALIYIAHSGLSARHLSDYAKEVLRKLR